MFPLNHQSLVQDYDGNLLYVDFFFFYRAMHYHRSIVKLQVILGPDVLPNNYYPFDSLSSLPVFKNTTLSLSPQETKYINTRMQIGFDIRTYQWADSHTNHTTWKEIPSINTLEQIPISQCWVRSWGECRNLSCLRETLYWVEGKKMTKMRVSGPMKDKWNK